MAKNGASLTEGQLVIGTHCLGRHSTLPFAHAHSVQFTDDHMSPSCGWMSTTEINRPSVCHPSIHHAAVIIQPPVTYASIHGAIPPSIFLPICQFIHSSVDLSVSRQSSLHPSIHHFIRPSILSFFCLSSIHDFTYQIYICPFELSI